MHPLSRLPFFYCRLWARIKATKNLKLEKLVFLSVFFRGVYFYQPVISFITHDWRNSWGCSVTVLSNQYGIEQRCETWTDYHGILPKTKQNQSDLTCAFLMPSISTSFLTALFINAGVPWRIHFLYKRTRSTFIYIWAINKFCFVILIQI